MGQAAGYQDAFYKEFNTPTTATAPRKIEIKCVVEFYKAKPITSTVVVTLDSGFYGL